MTLRRLILLDVIHQHLQAAAYAAVIEVIAEPPYLDGLATALMLARVDSGVEHMEYLIVASE
jgi:hypothetical protein